MMEVPKIVAWLVYVVALVTYQQRMPKLPDWLVYVIAPNMHQHGLFNVQPSSGGRP